MPGQFSLGWMNDSLVTDLSQFIDAQIHELELRAKYSRRHLKELYEEVMMHLHVASADLKILEQLGER